MTTKQTDSISRYPIPTDEVEMFWAHVVMLSRTCNVPAYPQIYHCVELLGQAVDRYVVEKKLGGPVKLSPNDEIKRFIAIFKSRYLKLTDIEYERLIKPEDCSVMKLAIKKLHGADGTVEAYLEWAFDVFLPENPRLCPPSIRMMCSHAFLDKFLFATKDERDQKMKEEVKKKEIDDLTVRGRCIIRMLPGEVEKATRVLLQRYSKGEVDIDELRRHILAAEQKVAKEKKE